MAQLVSAMKLNVLGSIKLFSGSLFLGKVNVLLFCQSKIHAVYFEL